MLVPTLRCVLDCGDCQVSRASDHASGFDWTEKTLAAVLSFLDRLATDEVKIEFQGRKPTLRLDLLERVQVFCRSRCLWRLMSLQASGLFSTIFSKR